MSVATIAVLREQFIALMDCEKKSWKLIKHLSLKRHKGDSKKTQRKNKEDKNKDSLMKQKTHTRDKVSEAKVVLQNK